MAESLTITRLIAPTDELVTLLEALDLALSGPYLPSQRHALSVDQLFAPNVRSSLPKGQMLAPPGAAPTLAERFPRVRASSGESVVVDGRALVGLQRRATVLGRGAV